MIWDNTSLRVVVYYNDVENNRRAINVIYTSFLNHCECGSYMAYTFAVYSWAMTSRFQLTGKARLILPPLRFNQTLLIPRLIWSITSRGNQSLNSALQASTWQLHVFLHLQLYVNFRTIYLPAALKMTQDNIHLAGRGPVRRPRP